MAVGCESQQSRRKQMTKPKGYVDAEYLEAALRKILPVKQKSYELMRVAEGDMVLDVGCGPGIDTVALAKLVGPSGKVIGVDYDKEMISHADNNAQKANVQNRCEHRYADAKELPFEPNTFDSCRSERLFQHLLDPERVLKEMIRVTKPGGWIIVIDTDWGTLSADTTEPEIARRLWKTKAIKLHHNGYSGRKLFRMMKEQGIEEVTAEPYVLSSSDYEYSRWMIKADELEEKAVTDGVVTKEELERLKAGFEKADKKGIYFGTIGGVIAAGQKPSG
jgi:ubiquinone/menaquinone biosynthesis C-methylase UbiE